MINKKELVIRNIIGIVIIALLVFIDQFTKNIAVSKLKGKEAYHLIKDVLLFKYAENKGAAFSILQNKQIPLIIVTIAIVVFIVFMFEVCPNNKRMRPVQIIYVFIIAGAIGNMIDRITLNYVVDFIYFKPINFPIFNFADICVTCSCILLVVLFLFYYKDDDAITVLKKKETVTEEKQENAKEN